MTQTKKPGEPAPAEDKPTETTQTALSPEASHRLDLKSEREARRQAEVGQIVRGEGG